MLIGEIAEFFGVSRKAIRLYEKKGILKPVEVDACNGYRYYSPDQVRQLNALLELKERACNMRTGCFRLLDRTLSNVGRILAERGEDTVTVKIIEQASSMMML